MSGTNNTRRRRWQRYSDERLLGLQMRNLGLRLNRSRLEPRVEQLYEELERKGIEFRPHAWLSSEWFSPDGVPGIAIPFYLAHPRLMKLEAKQMLQVEGGTPGSCMRILRHEAGHAIDTAYRLHFKKRWRETFGKFSQVYPRFYRPNPNSKRYVLHFDAWYAQAHPAEDFAETFAVWLTPRSDWRERYRSWPVALRKLKYVDELMREIAGRAPVVRSRRKVEPLSSIRETLGEHYRRKRARYQTDSQELLDRDLLKMFSRDKRYSDRPTAASFLRGLRGTIGESVAAWTGAHAYTVDQILLEMIERCKELKLRLACSQRRAKTEALMLLTVRTMNFLNARRYEIAL